MVGTTLEWHRDGSASRSRRIGASGDFADEDLATTTNRRANRRANRYTHILFDHDGVLVDTEPLYYRAARECLAHLGVDLALLEYLERMTTGASSWDLACRLGARESDIEYWHAWRNALY